MNLKQQQFVRHYLICLNGTQAAILAGYSPKTAQEQSSRLLSNVKVRAAVEKAQGRIATKLDITVERIAIELAKLGFSNMQDYIGITSGGDPYTDLSKLTRDQAAALQEITVEEYTEGRGEDARQVKRTRFKLADKRAALVDLGKHIGMFKDAAPPANGPTFNGPINVMVKVDARDRLAEILVRQIAATAEESGTPQSE